MKIKWTDSNIETLLDVFYDIYLRAPSQTEFNVLTGIVREIINRYVSYRNFLDTYNYDLPYGSKTYDVVNSRDKIVYTGTLLDIGEKLGLAKSTLSYAANRGNILCKEYRIVSKPFDRELVLEKLKEELENE